LLWTITPVSAQAALSKHEVSSMEQLVKAVGSNRIIKMKPGIYHVDPRLKTTPYVKWKSAQSPTLVMHHVKNLSIQGSGAKQTKLVSSSCNAEILEFESASSIRLQGVGFGRMLPGKAQELDCSPDLRGEILEQSLPPFTPRPEKILNWQQVASQIGLHQSQGIQLPEYTEPLYPNLIEQVKGQTFPIQPEQDAIFMRVHSLRPHLGVDYQLKGKQIFKAHQMAQAAAMIFDRDHNILAVMDAQAQVIYAVEARNNTRQSWNHPPDWLMQNSMVMNSNAPAPNGVYAFGTLIQDNPRASFNFGSFRIVLEGGVLTQREILFHSRDHKLNQEIPWHQDLNDEEIRTLGCFLFQDPDLQVLAQLLLNANRPVALVIQGSYTKNIHSPSL